jgi:sporulation protein YlmC with PRC-barrel domain
MKLLFNVLIVVAAITPRQLLAQDEGFLYGKVYTTDNKTYEGPIRWGKEEVYWVDLFNADKGENPNLRYLTSREREELNNRQNTWDNWGGNFVNRLVGWTDSENNRYYNGFEHQFACQFGEIKKIIPSGRKYVDVELQNGTRITLKGEGYNDVGTNVRVMDDELGEIDLPWSRISTVEFLKAPKKITNKFGKPLYGTVEAFGKNFTGYIQWDHDERLSSDKLDGDTDDGKLAIEFEKIKSIERRGSRSLVVLKSGREVVMSGSNDVDKSNRGIIIMNSEWIAVDVPWSEFNKLTLTETASAPAVSYDAFTSQKELTGTVVTRDGKTLSGKIVFDLDEEFSYELLQGNSGEIKYTTPFYQIKRIEPISPSRSEIELKSGEKISLYDAQDVNERNQGVLVFSKGGDNPVYVPWDSVKSIEFK